MAAPVRMSRAETRTLIKQFASLGAVFRRAAPVDKAEIYRGLNLTLTYQPAAQIVRAEARLATDSHGVMVRVRGTSRTLRTRPRSQASSGLMDSTEQVVAVTEPG